MKDLEQQLLSCPDDSCGDIALRLSIMHYRAGMPDKASAVLNGLKEGSRDERIYRTLAVYCREMYDWTGAIDALENARKKFVIEPQTEFELAETYLYAGFFAKAAETFQDLLPQWRENPWRIYYQLGYLFLERNDLPQAKTYFEKSLKAKGDNTGARGLQAYIYSREGNVKMARELWEKNLTEDPDNPTILANMGLSLEMEGKYAEALTYYNKAAALNKGDAQIWIDIGNCLAAMGQRTEAMVSYKTALKSTKRDVAAYDIFLLYASKKDKEQAEAMLQLLEKEFPGSSHVERRHCPGTIAAQRFEGQGTR